MRAYQDMVFTTAARLTGNDAQAEDIAQDVFLKAYGDFDSLRTSPTAGGWLKTVTTNLTLNYLTRYRRRRSLFSELRNEDDSPEPEGQFAVPDTLLEGLDAQQRAQLIDGAMRKLPEHQRLPLALYHFEDMPYEEIARRLAISLAKVKVDILRARARLAILLRNST